MLQFKWLRRFIRRNTSPIPGETAEIWKNKLSLMYALVAWNAFGFVCYMVYKGRGDWAKHHGLTTSVQTPAVQWSQTLGIKEAKVYRISGLNVSSYEIHNEFNEKKENTNTVITKDREDTETLKE